MNYWRRLFGFRKKNTADLAPEESAELMPPFLDQWEYAQAYLAIRLHHPSSLQSFPVEELLSRQDLDGILSVLVFDLPDSVECVLRTQLERWNKKEEEVFAIALRNMREKYSRQWQKGKNLFLEITEPDSFACTEALLLDRHTMCIGKFGTLFCMPQRDVLWCAPIAGDIDLEVSLQRMIPSCQELFEKAGETQLSDQIFWYYQGHYERLYSFYTPGRLKYILPADLEELVYG
ncbi:MAG: hypothetical protein MUF42_06350 [Cytophagaceae bacterium]|jgi:hypothetical protein|nr:hypothetical protein [Cytophagaceae bacterium]